MRMRFPLASVRFLLIGLGVGLVLGCGKRELVVEEQEPSRDNLLEIVAAYRHAQQQLGRPPRRLEELRAHFAKPDRADGLLRSPTDGELYEIAWGADVHTPPPDQGTPILLAYERKGSNGKRWVATIWGTTRPLTDAEFKQAGFPKGHQPPRS